MILDMDGLSGQQKESKLLVGEVIQVREFHSDHKGITIILRDDSGNFSLHLEQFFPWG